MARATQKPTSKLYSYLLFVFILDLHGNVTAVLSARIGQMKYLPAIFAFVKVKGIDAAMAEVLIHIKSVIAPGLRKIPIDLNFNIPYFFIPDFLMRCTYRF